jgi:hypothetical protein
VTLNYVPLSLVRPLPPVPPTAVTYGEAAGNVGWNLHSFGAARRTTFGFTALCASWGPGAAAPRAFIVGLSPAHTAVAARVNDCYASNTSALQLRVDARRVAGGRSDPSTGRGGHCAHATSARSAREGDQRGAAAQNSTRDRRCSRCLSTRARRPTAEPRYCSGRRATTQSNRAW